MTHGPKCPNVKAMEFHPDGSVKRVEFFAPNDYPPIQVFPGGATPSLPPYTTSAGWNPFIHTGSGHAP